MTSSNTGDYSSLFTNGVQPAHHGTTAPRHHGTTGVSILVFHTLLVTGCSVEGTTPEAAIPWERVSLNREAGDDPLEVRGPRIQLGDGEYYYALADGVVPPAYVVRGAVTWRYDGQAVFSTGVSQEATSSPWVVPLEVAGTDRPEAYFGVGTGHRVDSLGRRWVVESVDPETMAAEVDAYNVMVEEMFGGPEVTDEAVAPTETTYRSDAGELVDLTNTSWSRCYCADDADVGYVFWNHSSDALDNAVAPLVERLRSVVWRASGSGSGTVVDNDWILTAAHLVTDANGDALDPTGMVWCTAENLGENNVHTPAFTAACYDTLDITPNPGWSGGSDPVNDYAVVQLDGFPNVDLFPISQASDATITGPTDRTAGYQRRTTGCGTNTITSDSLTVDDDYNGRHLKTAEGEVQSTPAGQVKYDTSTALGMSGGVHYYCPGEDCPTNHFITAVQTNVSVNTCSGLVGTNCLGNSCTGGYSTGPKGSSIRTWVINNTP